MYNMSCMTLKAFGSFFKAMEFDPFKYCVKFEKILRQTGQTLGSGSGSGFKTFTLQNNTKVNIPSRNIFDQDTMKNVHRS
jgi:hypothetical protein